MPLDRTAAIAQYRRNRERSRALFDMLADEALYSRPIALRHPVVFYAGHLPAFSFNTLVKRGLGEPGIDARLESLFARGIDPEQPGDPSGIAWPPRDQVDQFVAEADSRVLDALARADLERDGHPLLDRGEAVFTILEHELMHQETLLYMWHRLPLGLKTKPEDYEPLTDGEIPPIEWVEVSGGRVTMGADRRVAPFGWDNEFPRLVVDVAPFAIERHDVTNARFLEFVEAGGYQDDRWWQPADWRWVREDGIRHPVFWTREDGRWWWRGMFERMPLPLSWPVYLSQGEATAYARWRGARLPTEAEYQRAAYGSLSGERPYPWGDAAPDERHGVFDFSSWDPEPAGTHPDGTSAWGVEDLVGNGWEWTSSLFQPFPGFKAMASYLRYSADFFDGQHFVMKGASPATAHELIRPPFRNWFRAQYPFVYATCRCVKSL